MIERDTVDKEAFERAKLKVMLKQHDPHGFGTLQEKTIHAVMKQYYAPDEEQHEIPVEGYIADIYTGDAIIEIQNGNFYKIRDKLSAFLPLYDVTIVYPIPHKKWLMWVDPETGHVSEKRKSPLTGSGYSAFPELYRIKPYLKDPHLHLRFPLVDVEEYRLLNGRGQNRKKGSERFDRIPVSLEDEIVVDRLQDYLQFVPFDLPDSFTSKEFSKAANVTKELTSVVLNILYHVGTIYRIGKQKNSYIYGVNNDYTGQHN